MKNYRLTAIILSVCLIIGFLSSCGVGTGTESTTDANFSELTEKPSGTESEIDSDEQDEETTANENDTETEKPTDITLEGKYADDILNADALANGVKEYYKDANGNVYSIENLNASLLYSCKPSDEGMQVSALMTPEGATYIKDTFDVFVKMTDGSTYFSSKSSSPVETNVFRFGYYYHMVRVEGQDFINGMKAVGETELSISPMATCDIKRATVTGGKLKVVVENSRDPYLVFFNPSSGQTYDADKYKYLQITIKTNDDNASAAIYFAAGENEGASFSQLVNFDLICDGKSHTYTVYLGGHEEYSGTLREIRLDFNNMEAGMTAEISELKLIEAKDIGVSSLSLARTFNTYSDKIHHVAQVVATEATSDIAEIGMLTKIDASTVNKIIVKDAIGLHDTLDNVDWNSAEYVGFDIADAGIFGYIIPVHETSGKLSVTLEGEEYVIIQSRVPDNNTILPGDKNKIGNQNDFYLGQRLYTDTLHDFDTFINEAEAERNPLTSENIIVHESREDAEFLGYDSLRGSYNFRVEDSMSFNPPFYLHTNRHYTINFTVNGDEFDRRSYFMVSTTDSGALECAAILGDDLMMLPIPIEVCKNFRGDGDNTIYDQLDSRYGEAIFPLVSTNQESKTYSLLHLYQNWGRYPLKQISSIEFFVPYYHLSVGVTESNCIKYGSTASSMLPDHRALSAPYWTSQPQHMSGGSHTFVKYKDSNGNEWSARNIGNRVLSYGPTYAEIELDYITGDGKIKTTYLYNEMPQTDENRAYMTFTHNFVEDISFNDFKTDFSFYEMSNTGFSGRYHQMSYVDENNNVIVKDLSYNGSASFYRLGSEAPYFTLFDKKDTFTDGWGYINLSFLISSAEIIINGEQVDVPFIIRELNGALSLSLDLGKVTFKAGDSIVINAIVLPWGSHTDDYSGEDYAPDRIVREVRENSILDPIKISAGNATENMDFDFVPSVRSLNGKSAEFTLTGGENNFAVRVYGLSSLSVPVISELTDAGWISYPISSALTPDYSGYAAHYDGYNVFYDGDGTYSYSFVVTMTDGAPRTFRFELIEDFEGFPDIVIPEEKTNDVFNVYLGYKELARKAGQDPQFSIINVDDNEEYVSFHASPFRSQSYIDVFSNSDGINTGRYLVIKYRLPETNPEKIELFKIYASTNNNSYNANDLFEISSGIEADGEWHILVVDLVAFGSDSVLANSDGTCKINYVRFYPINQVASEQTRVDIQYVAIHDDYDSDILN